MHTLSSLSSDNRSLFTGAKLAKLASEVKRITRNQAIRVFVQADCEYRARSSERGDIAIALLLFVLFIFAIFIGAALLGYLGNSAMNEVKEGISAAVYGTATPAPVK